MHTYHDGRLGFDLQEEPDTELQQLALGPQTIP